MLSAGLPAPSLVCLWYFYSLHLGFLCKSTGTVQTLVSSGRLLPLLSYVVVSVTSAPILLSYVVIICLFLTDHELP